MPSAKVIDVPRDLWRCAFICLVFVTFPANKEQKEGEKVRIAERAAAACNWNTRSSIAARKKNLLGLYERNLISAEEERRRMRISAFDLRFGWCLRIGGRSLFICFCWTATRGISFLRRQKAVDAAQTVRTRHGSDWFLVDCEHYVCLWTVGVRTLDDA